ncbi:MAG: hypothetical protein AAFW67_13760, partial [Cyanobacteria bacterium J06638_38]
WIPEWLVDKNHPLGRLNGEYVSPKRHWKIDPKATGGKLIGGGSVKGSQFGARYPWLAQRILRVPSWLRNSALGGLLGNIFGDDIANALSNIVNSFDPNDIIGPAGFGEQGWIPSPQILPYTIRFENEAERATAPAVLVSIIHTLDPDLDLDSFELGDFGFGDLVVDVPDGFQNYSERLDLRNTIGSFVDFEATLDRATGTVTWTLTTIDPATGALATGVDDGFLPPNEDGNGEGFVRYTIQAQDDLTTGTEISAVADIIFDFNEPIITPLIFNTIDVDEPTSNVLPLPATTPPNFPVNWLGSDDGSGIASYDIFVSVNGEPFTLWQDDITETEAIYPGVVGNSYSFYSIAT